jgi:apolipoprotein N-acyltransferase
MKPLYDLSAWSKRLLLTAAGSVTTFAFAPFFISPLLLLTFPLLLTLSRHATSTKATFWTGWWFGLGYGCASIYWFSYALLVDAARFGWLIPFALGGIGGALAVYYGLTTLLVHRFRQWPIVPYSLAFALSWVGMEGLRSVLFSGFPWNLLGYSWNATTVSLQAASIGGVWWLSLLTVVLASTPLWWKAKAYIPFFCAMVGFAALLVYGGVRLHQNPTAYEADILLRVVQANIPQTLKWDKNAEMGNLQKHISLSLSDRYSKVTHLIWPESAMTFRLEQGGFWANELAKIVPLQGALTTGVVRMERNEAGSAHLFNSLNVLRSNGNISAVYDKRKLVPFGEYVPLRSVLPLDKITPGGQDFSVGSYAGAIAMHGAPDFRPQICYEAIFPWLSADTYPHWILNITNDGWFGLSSGPYQHFDMTRMRAVEQGVPLIRAASGGISAAVDAYGRVLHSLPLNTHGVMDTRLPKPATSPTIYGRYGQGVLLLTMVGMVCVIRWQRRIAH